MDIVLLGDLILVYKDQSGLSLNFIPSSLTQGPLTMRYIATEGRGIFNLKQKFIKCLIYVVSLLFM